MIQSVVSNLLVSKIEVRTDEALDVKKYIHEKIIQVVPVTLNSNIKSVFELFYAAANVPVSLYLR